MPTHSVVVADLEQVVGILADGPYLYREDGRGGEAQVLLVVILRHLTHLPRERVQDRQ